MSVVKPYKKVANNGNVNDKEPITITLDTLDGASDVNLTEVEISDSVTSTGTNVVTGKGVYDAINALHTQVAVETSSSVNLNGISYLKAPAITAAQLKQLATAFMEQKTAYIHYTPTGGVQHYYKIEAGNTKTVETVEYSEIHIHGDIDNENATNPGDSLCVELIYQCTDGATVEVSSNPYFIPANGLTSYTGVNTKLPSIDASYITPKAYKLGKYGVPMKIIYNNTSNGDISYIDVINCGYRAAEGEVKGTSRNAGYYITFSWNDILYNLIVKGDNTIVAEVASALGHIVLNVTEFDDDMLPVFNAEDFKSVIIQATNENKTIDIRANVIDPEYGSYLYAMDVESVSSFLEKDDAGEYIGTGYLIYKFTLIDPQYIPQDKLSVYASFTAISYIVTGKNANDEYVTILKTKRYESGAAIVELRDTETYNGQIIYPEISNSEFENILALSNMVNVILCYNYKTTYDGVEYNTSYRWPIDSIFTTDLLISGVKRRIGDIWVSSSQPYIQQWSNPELPDQLYGQKIQIRYRNYKITNGDEPFSYSYNVTTEVFTDSPEFTIFAKTVTNKDNIEEPQVLSADLEKVCDMVFGKHRYDSTMLTSGGSGSYLSAPSIKLVWPQTSTFAHILNCVGATIGASEGTRLYTISFNGFSIRKNDKNEDRIVGTIYLYQTVNLSIRDTWAAPAITQLTTTLDVPTKVSQLDNDAGYTTYTGTVTSVNGSTPDTTGAVTIALPIYTFDSTTGTLNIS